MNKKYLLYAIIPVAALTIAGSVVYAESASTANGNPMGSLVAKIAQKFNLNISDVQQVFDEQKTEMEAKMKQKMTDDLNDAVSKGKLTQDQANKIIAKKAELDASKPAAGENKKEDMKSKQDALKQWATDNGIPQQYLRFLGFGGFGRGHRGPGEMGIPPEDAAQQNNSAN